MNEPRSGNPQGPRSRFPGLSPVVVFLVLLVFLAGCGGDSTSTPASTSGPAPTDTPPTQSPTQPAAEPTEPPTPALEPGVPSLQGSWRTQFAGGAPVTVRLTQSQRNLVGPVISDSNSTLAVIEGNISGENTVVMEVFWQLVGFQLGAIPLPASAWPQAVADRGDRGHPGTVRSDLTLTYDPENDELKGTYTAVIIVIDESTGEFKQIKTDVVPILLSRVEQPTPQVEIIEAKMIGPKQLRISVEVIYSGEDTQRDISVTVEFRNNDEETLLGTLTIEESGISESQGDFSLDVDLEVYGIPRFMGHMDLDITAEVKETWPDSTTSPTGTNSKKIERAILLPVIVTHGIIGDFADLPVLGLGSVGPGLKITVDALAEDGYKKDGPYPTAHILVYPSFHADGIEWIAENKLDRIINEVLAVTYAERLDIVAHSMGGLISRYYIESSPGLNKGDKVRKLVMVGTPNEGAAGAHTALEGDSRFVPRAEYLLTLAKLAGRLGQTGATEETNIGLRTNIQLLPAYRYYLESARKPFPSVRGYGWPTDTDPRMDLQKGKSERLEFNTLLDGLNQDGLDDRVDYYNIYQTIHETETTIRREQGRLGFWSVIQVAGPGDGTVPVQSALLTDFPAASAQLNKCHIAVEQDHPSMLLASGVREMIREILKSPFDQPPDSCKEETTPRIGIDFDIKQSFSSDPLETLVDDDRENTVGLLLVENNDDDDFNLVEDNLDESITGEVDFFGVDQKDEDKKDMATLILHRLESNNLPSGRVFIKKQSGVGNVRIFKASDNSLILTTAGQTSSTTDVQAHALFNTLIAGSETYLVEGVDPGEIIVILEYVGGEVEARDEILITVVDPAFDAQIRLVDFVDNQEISLDRFEDPPQLIDDTDRNTVEWKDDDCDGNTNKNWPVAYERNSQVTINIQFCVDIKEDGVDSITVAIRGVAQVNGAELVYERNGVTLRNGTNTIIGLTSQGNLPNFVTYIEPMIIEWTVTAGISSDPAGASRHNVYTTLSNPRNPKLSPIPFTMIHFTTHGADGATTEQATVDGIWSQFATQHPTPQIRRREYDLMTGIINTGGQPLRYYKEVLPGMTLEESFGEPFLCNTETALLRLSEGRCGVWASFLVDALDIHGIAAKRLWLGVSHDGAVTSPTCPLQPFSPTPTECLMLVNNWSFAANGGTSGDPDYPFKWDEVVDEKGVAGQSVENPQPFFWDHVVVLVKITTDEGTINENSTEKLYDPSYGIGPFDEDGEDYEIAAISGFCKPEPGSEFAQGPYFCRKNPPGIQLTQGDL